MTDKFEMIIDFQKSKSLNFEVALELAKPHPSFRECGKYEITLTEKDLELAVKLLRLVKGWASTFVTVGGKLRSNRDTATMVECAYKNQPVCEMAAESRWCDYCPLDDARVHLSIHERIEKDLGKLLNSIEGRGLDDDEGDEKD